MVVAYISQALGALLTAKPIFGNDNAWYLYPVVKKGHVLAFPSSLFQVGLLLCVPQLTLYRCFPESPKFLSIQKRRNDMAYEAIRWFHGDYADLRKRRMSCEILFHSSETNGIVWSRASTLSALSETNASDRCGKKGMHKNVLNVHFHR